MEGSGLGTVLCGGASATPSLEVELGAEEAHVRVDGVVSLGGIKVALGRVRKGTAHGSIFHIVVCVQVDAIKGAVVIQRGEIGTEAAEGKILSDGRLKPNRARAAEHMMVGAYGESVGGHKATSGDTQAWVHRLDAVREAKKGLNVAGRAISTARAEACPIVGLSQQARWNTLASTGNATRSEEGGWGC
jgi:hypothetical protein